MPSRIFSHRTRTTGTVRSAWLVDTRSHEGRCGPSQQQGAATRAAMAALSGRPHTQYAAALTTRHSSRQFYKYAVEEELMDHSPAAHVRRPPLDYESHAPALDRNELGALLVAAGLGPPLEHALISLLALNGLRVSEATGADIEHLGLERGHRTLTITRIRAASSSRFRSRLAPPGRSTWPPANAAPAWSSSPPRAAAGPARHRADRPQGRPASRDQQERGSAHATAQVLRRARRRHAAARRPRGRLPR